MDDQLQVIAAQELNQTAPDQTLPEPPVTFSKELEEVNLDLQPLEAHGMAEGSIREAVDSSEEITQSLLPDETRPSRFQLWRCCLAYRSSNPEQRVTPFAMVLLIVLFIIYVLNQADRLVLAVLIPAGLRCDLGNSSNDTSCVVPSNQSDSENRTDFTDCIEFNDFEQGLLTGPAFTIIYVLAGLPLAWLADTASRSLVLIIGLSFWSAMIVLSGSVVVFWQLLVLRIFLGVGEVRENEEEE